MNLDDIPKSNFQEMDDDFFKSQANHIFSKTISIEKWELPGTKNTKAYFHVPDGYWLRMEEGIRSRILPQRNAQYSPFGFWKPTFAVAFSLLVLFAFSWFWFLKPASQSENWKARLDKVSDSELMAYVETRPGSEVQEITENLASRVLTEADLVGPDLKLTEEELDENLGDLSEQDIFQNIDTL